MQVAVLTPMRAQSQFTSRYHGVALYGNTICSNGDSEFETILGTLEAVVSERLTAQQYTGYTGLGMDISAMDYDMEGTHFLHNTLSQS